MNFLETLNKSFGAFHHLPPRSNCGSVQEARKMAARMEKLETIIEAHGEPTT